MAWADNRRLLIIAGLLFVVIVVLSVTLIVTLPKEPTCSDNLMNQDEAGVDCGGSCAYLCKEDVAAPSASLMRALTSHGRVDIVGLVENRNPSAFVEDAAYTVEIFSPDGVLLASAEGKMDIPAGESVPVFIPGVAPAGIVVGRVFLSFDDVTLNWVRNAETRKLPRADAIQSANIDSAPRVTANMFNPSPIALRNVEVIATVFDAGGAVIGATRTIAEVLPPEASVPLTFSWNEPFTSAPGRIDVRAIVPLP